MAKNVVTSFKDYKETVFASFKTVLDTTPCGKVCFALGLDNLQMSLWKWKFGTESYLYSPVVLAADHKSVNVHM